MHQENTPRDIGIYQLNEKICEYNEIRKEQKEKTKTKRKKEGAKL
jgi:hypothetical protein